MIIVRSNHHFLGHGKQKFVKDGEVWRRFEEGNAEETS
jgi:hypothetical protein